ncbi:hypothetical protein [Methylobacterium indicum]|uniref:hypothetical protein n=1 Tax=Methylobacterium indicum TaxID=1775910 RepID=UPI000A4C76EB|nr:hypothetical protein [Methylobacterium indicum]
MKSSQKHNLFGFIPYQGGDGFCLPVFSLRANPNDYFIQIPDVFTNKVSKYRKLDGIIQSDLIKFDSENHIDTDSLIFVFRSESKIIISELGDVQSKIVPLMNKYENNPAILQQIAEISGTPQYKKYARAKMRQHLRDTIGESAASFYHEGSVLRSAFWDVLIALAPDWKAANHIIANKLNISAWIEDGKIQIDVKALSDSSYDAVKTASIIQLINDQFDPCLQNEDFSSVPTLDNDILSDIKEVPRQERVRLSQLVAQIRKSPRQEERLVLFMKYLIDYPHLNFALSKEYDFDKAKFANQSIKELKKTFGNKDKINNRDLYMAKFLVKFFSTIFPMQRGALVWYAAMHLGKYRHLNGVILSKFKNMEFRFTETGRAEIREALDV